ncbi:DUF1294 domain-containing protein [Fusibacter tunisiensis]|uniref:Uncharacterized membrane protein YsdA (DUF1294 family) n=1 Tax=Fusibacter tunisiensis TaxID=1008308 RepID=A0ABS2MSN3_9FIRM|nr:uncharacterized membrane protein YsdA (DUF1294 family) [Fusibacter tunisiensis]
MINSVIYTILGMNVLVFLLMGLDKSKAVHGKWRIPEKWLLIMGFFGGGIGFSTSMIVFKHKLSKGYFRWTAFVGSLILLGSGAWYILKGLK